MAPTKKSDTIRTTKRKDKHIKLKKKVHKTKDKIFVKNASRINKKKVRLQNKNKEAISYTRDTNSIINENKYKFKRSNRKESKILSTFTSVSSPKIQISEEEKAEINSRTVFVGNLPKSVTRKKLKKFFAKFGEVESARLRCSALNVSHLPRPIAIDKRDFHPKATSVIGFVKFSSKDSVEKALEANGTLYEDHTLRVDRVDSNKTENVQNSVFLGNLPFDVSDNAVRKHFEDCGKIISIHVVRDGSTGLGKGFGYVNFKDPASVELALKLNESQLVKRKIRVKKAVKKFADKRQNENKLNEDQLESDEKVFSFKPQRKKEKKKKDNPELAFQGRTANKIKKKTSKKKLMNKLTKKRLVEVLNKT